MPASQPVQLQVARQGDAFYSRLIQFKCQVFFSVFRFAEMGRATSYEGLCRSKLSISIRWSMEFVELIQEPFKVVLVPCDYNRILQLQRFLEPMNQYFKVLSYI